MHSEHPKADANSGCAEELGSGFGHCHGCCADGLRGKRLAVRLDWLNLMNLILVSFLETLVN